MSNEQEQQDETQPCVWNNCGRPKDYHAKAQLWHQWQPAAAPAYPASSHFAIDQDGAIVALEGVARGQTDNEPLSVRQAFSDALVALDTAESLLVWAQHSTFIGDQARIGAYQARNKLARITADLKAHPEWLMPE